MKMKKIKKSTIVEAQKRKKKILEFYDVLTAKACTLCSRFKNVKSILEENRNLFIDLPFNNKCSLLKSILIFYRGGTARINLTPIKGSANAGGITNGFIKNDTKNVVFIDQSVTGMFERKTYL